jgi:hypothetical protein
MPVINSRLTPSTASSSSSVTGTPSDMEGAEEVRLLQVIVLRVLITKCTSADIAVHMPAILPVILQALLDRYAGTRSVHHVPKSPSMPT